MHGREEVPDQKVVTAFALGDTEIELLEGTSSDSPVTQFLKGEEKVSTI